MVGCLPVLTRPDTLVTNRRPSSSSSSSLNRVTRVMETRSVPSWSEVIADLTGMVNALKGPHKKIFSSDLDDFEGSPHSDNQTLNATFRGPLRPFRNETFETKR